MPSPYSCLLLGLNFTHEFSTFSPKVAQGNREWVLWSVHHMFSLLLLSPHTLLTLSSHSSMGFLPQETAVHGSHNFAKQIKYKNKRKAISKPR